MPTARPLSRRQFLAGAGAASVAGAAAVAVAHGPIERALDLTSGASATRTSARPATKAALTTGKGTLVLIAMYGGSDGLNAVVPYTDSAYLGARPTLGFQPHEVIPLDNELGLNPNLAGLKTLWDHQSLAIVRGVGHPDPTFSHFREMDIWQSAVPDRDEITGWMGRYLDQSGGKDPLFAMSLGPTLPKLLQGEKSAGSAIPSGTLSLPHGAALEAPFKAVETSYAGESYLGGRVAQSGTDLLTVLHSVADVLSTEPSIIGGTNLETAPPDSRAPETTSTTVAGAAPDKGGAHSNPVAEQLDLVARLIKGGLSTRVYVVSVGGYDTHANEKETQNRLLGELDGAVTGFVDAMAADPKGHDVVVMTFSEFGRRVAQNASGGTDHGTSAPLFIAGPAVRGGYYGEQPSLSDLDNGNLKTTTDFRSVYATLTGKVLGIDPQAVLEGQSFPILGFV